MDYTESHRRAPGPCRGRWLGKVERKRRQGRGLSDPPGRVGPQAEDGGGRWNRRAGRTNGHLRNPSSEGAATPGSEKQPLGADATDGQSNPMGKSELQTDLQLYMRQINEIGLLNA